MPVLPEAPPAEIAQRMFLALWPNDAVRARLAATCRALELNGGRLIAAQNLHVTLVFLGAVDAARRACVETALSSVRGNAFEFALTRVEWRRRGGMVWLAAPEVPAALRELAASLNAALIPCGHRAEPRPFRLHVTAARDVRRAGRRQALAPIVWRAHDFCLVSSRLTPEGSEYSIDRRWPLSGHPAS